MSSSVFYYNDAFTVQRYKTAAGFVLPNGCRQGAIFHFQVSARLQHPTRHHAPVTTLYHHTVSPRLSPRLQPHPSPHCVATLCHHASHRTSQEWKKAWAGQGGYGETGSMVGVEGVGSAPRYSARPRNFSITPEGISILHPLGSDPTSTALR